MGPDPAGIHLLERKGEGVERLRCAQPDEAVGALLHVDAEPVRIGLAEAAVDAVRGNDQVPIAPCLEVGLALMLIMDRDAEFLGAGRQYLQQALPADADEAMA